MTSDLKDRDQGESEQPAEQLRGEPVYHVYPLGAPPDQIDLLRLVGILWRSRWLVAVVTGVAGTAALVFALVTAALPPASSPFPETYRASALLLIGKQSSTSALLSTSALGGLADLAGIPTGGGFGEVAVALLQSRSTADAIVEDFDLFERYTIVGRSNGKARAAFASHLDVAINPATGIVTVGYDDYSPEFARDVVNRLVEILSIRFVSLANTRNLRERELLERKLSEVEDRILELEAEIMTFQQTFGVLDVQSLAAEMIQRVADIRTRLILQNVEIETYSSIAAVNDPVLVRLRAERESLRQLLRDLETGASEVDSLTPSQDELPDLALRFTRMQRDLAVQTEIFKILAQQLEVARLNVEGEEPIFQILELADAPDVASGPSRRSLVIVVTLAAFLIAVLVVFALHAVRTLRKDPERLTRLRGGPAED